MDHHAFLYFGDSIEALPIEEEYKTASADVTHIHTDNLGIEEVRKLITDAYQKPVLLSKRVFVIVARQITTEAQNALLKLFEDPPDQTLFFLVIPKQGVLLQTLLSRMFVVVVPTKQGEKNTVFTSFLSADYAKRLETVSLLTKEKDEENIEAILEGAEYYIQKNVLKNASTLESLLLARSYAGARGASKKMLLEELALSLPHT